MKKILIILLAVFPLVFSSCKKDDHQPGTLTGTLEGFMDKDTKVVYDPSSSDTPFSWQSGDKIKVYRNRQDGTYTGNATNAKGEYIAALTDDNAKAEFTLTGSVSSTNLDVTDDDAFFGNYMAGYPSNLFFQAGYSSNDGTVTELKPITPATYSTDANGRLLGNPMYAISSTKHLFFKHVFGLLRLRVQKSNAKLVSVKVSSNISFLRGQYSIQTNSTTPSVTYVGSGIKDVTLLFPQGVDINQQQDLFIPLPPGNYTDLTIEFRDDWGAKCVKTQHNGTLHIERAMYSTIALGENDLVFSAETVQGTIGGLFSVGTNKYVRFSQGNLQYLAAATGEYDENTWRFAEHQYDVCSQDANEYPSSTSTEWIDMFGWGTSGYLGSNPYNYQRSVTYGPASGGINTNANREYDWGYHNAISNGGNITHKWRTLTSGEWNYLLDRTNRKALAIVNNQRGVILLPDAWPETGEPLNREGNSSWTNTAMMNTYTAEEWAVLEGDGAIFLPQCGYRSTNNNDITSFNNVTSTSERYIKACYWAANTASANKVYRYEIDGSCTKSNPQVAIADRCQGVNVRLVRDIE